TLALAYSSTGNSPTAHAGSYALTAVVGDGSGRASDYRVTFSSGTLTVSKANAVIVVTPYSVTYDGQAHTASGTATGVFGEALGGLDLTGTAHTNAGTTTDAWTFIDATGNYNDASGTVSDRIARAALT